MSNIHTDNIDYELSRAADTLGALKHNMRKSLLKRLDAVVSEITEEAQAFKIFSATPKDYAKYRVLMAQLEAVALTLADESFAAILD